MLSTCQRLAVFDIFRRCRACNRWQKASGGMR
jgi:hypothetical protein